MFNEQSFRRKASIRRNRAWQNHPAPRRFVITARAGFQESLACAGFLIARVDVLSLSGKGDLEGLGLQDAIGLLNRGKSRALAPDVMLEALLN